MKHQTLILLHGVSGPKPFYKDQAEFFARHGFRVLLPHYFEAGHGTAATDENYEAWVSAVREIMTEAQNSEDTEGSAIAIVGFSLGASVALALGSEGRGPDAIVEVSGSLPDRYFRDLKGMPPLLILHGKSDEAVSVKNALQLSRLCSDAELICETTIFPNEGHVFTGKTLQAANQQMLDFFSRRLSLH